MGKATVPLRHGPIAALLRPLVSRVDRLLVTLEASRSSDREVWLRESLEVTPDNSDLWFQLGLQLAASERTDEAVQAMLRAAELGEKLGPALRVLVHRDPLRLVVDHEEHVQRVLRIAEASPKSALKQLTVGAFLLDLGRLEPGRELVRRGYLLRYPDLFPTGDAGGLDRTSVLPPSFFIVGPHKSGTTSLNSFLIRHPRVIAGPRKELRFLGNTRGRPPEVYDAYFPRLDPDLGFAAGDASPAYLLSQEAARTIAERFPAAKAIVLHRDPVSRTYSHFQMQQRTSAKSREFDDAIAGELQRVGDSPPLDFSDIPDVHAPFLLGSCILPYLKMWIDTLGPDRVLVVESSFLSRQRGEALAEIHDYLGLPPAPVPASPDRNVYEYAPISPASAERLREWFAPHEAALDEFLASHPARIPAR
jgi:hypothetical protein